MKKVLFIFTLIMPLSSYAEQEQRSQTMEEFLNLVEKKDSVNLYTGPVYVNVNNATACNKAETASAQENKSEIASSTEANSESASENEILATQNNTISVKQPCSNSGYGTGALLMAASAGASATLTVAKFLPNRLATILSYVPGAKSIEIARMVLGV